MKISWGWRIAALYIGFVLIVGGMVTAAFLQNDIHLVTKDYYREEIQYQKRLDKMNNLSKQNKSLEMRYDTTGAMVRFRFPDGDKELRGSILFYRPGDKNIDFKIPVSTDSLGAQVMPVGRFKKGKWRVKVDWNNGTTAFYDEKVLELK